jgi:hypothetical protein
MEEGDWEIDHPEPYRITHRTNFHELEALHRKCNRQKGGRTSVEIRNRDKLRKGQREAIQMLGDRVRRGERTTAVVLPCRVGKSDVIRVSTAELWGTGQIAVTLGLSPGELLRDQLADAARWNTAIERYGITLKRKLKITKYLKPKQKLNANGEAFVSATIQLVLKNLQDVVDWVDAQVHQTGLPVLVCVDECHSSSTDNEWGTIVPALCDAGAHVVLLTATPERADGKRIPGFRFTTEDKGEIKIWRSRPHSERPDELVTVDVYGGRKQKITLEPDYAMTFSEAWDEIREDGPILCKINRTPFDISLNQVKRGCDDKGIPAGWLNELPQSKVIECLGRVVRSPAAITEGVRRLLVQLDRYRQLDPHFQAIVYCGNDVDTVEDDVHPNAIRMELLWQRPSLMVRIATMTSSAEGDDLNGKAIIESFAGGTGDVLIVKQMAGLGLDLPWVKIGLDLSPTRAFPSLVQRLFRPATPHEGAVSCVWISPDDVISAAYFKRVVTDQGGEATATDLDLIESYDKLREEREKKLLVAGDATRPGKFDDCSGREGEPQQWEQVEEFVAMVPEVLAVVTHAEIAERLKARARQGEAPEDDSAAVRDTGIAADALRAEINVMAKKATIAHCRQENLPTYGESYRRAATHLWTQAYRMAGWPSRGGHGWVKLDESDDLDALQRVHDAWAEIGQQLWPAS